jgi:hypothetical protein
VSAIERHVSASPTVGSGEWALMRQQADVLAMSDIIPTAYRRKPANVVVAAMTGRMYGWDALTAMRNGHVIESSYAIKPEALLGMVRAAGHSVVGEMKADSATVTGKRADTGDELTITFSVEDAVRAGLVQIKDGKPYARSSSGTRLPWEQYPMMMCYWRAVGLLCRALFSDVTLGLYTAEELGAQIDVDGDVIDVGEVEHTPDQPAGAQPLSTEAFEQFVAACGQNGLAPDVVLVRAFGSEAGVPDPLTDAHLPAMRDAFKALVAEQAQAAGDGAGSDGTHRVGSEVPSRQITHSAPHVRPSPAPDERGPHPNDVVDDDGRPVGDDGILDAEVVEPGQETDGPVEAPAPAPAAPPANARPATRSQVGRIKAEWSRLGVARDDQLAESARLIGREITSHNHLTHDEAGSLIDTLQARKPEGAML